MAGKFANHILFNKAWNNTIQKLTMEQRGELLTALYAIANGEDYHSEDALLDILIGTYGDEIRQSISNYEEICQRNKENRSKKSFQQSKKRKNDRNSVDEKTTVPKRKKEEEKEVITSFSSEKEVMSAALPPDGGTPQTDTRSTYDKEMDPNYLGFIGPE